MSTAPTPRRLGLPQAGGTQASISEVFFRTTFELMGHVAKSDGRVSEAEIDAARNLMGELHLGRAEIDAAIACFRVGKSADYDAAGRVERLREVCARRHDLLRAFMELQLRAALAGNGVSPPAREILTRVAERLGMSGAGICLYGGGLEGASAGTQFIGRAPPARGEAAGRVVCGARDRRRRERPGGHQGVSSTDEPSSP